MSNPRLGDQKSTTDQDPPMLSYRVFRQRQCDFQKDSKNTLRKRANLFSKRTDSEYIPGSSSFGPVTKQGKEKQKNYFMLHHYHTEYFAFEIMQLFGVCTPKLRFDEKYNGSTNKTVYSKKIEGFIPDYEVDIQREQVVDDQKGRKYKLAGGMFAADILMNLLDDWDSGSTVNYGFKGVGKRYYFVAIDKDKAAFRGKSYREMEALMSPHAYYKFASGTSDQLEAMLYKLQMSLDKKSSDQCDIDRIFLNDRTKATFDEKELQKWCDNFKFTAQSCLDYYKEKGFLKHFESRERLREKIAEKAIAALCLKVDNPEDLKAQIVEDLRGRFYEKYFNDKNTLTASDANNQKLIEAIRDDMALELGLLTKSRYMQTVKEYVKYKKSFFGMWKDISRETKAVVNALDAAKDDAERYKIADDFTKSYPNKAFSQRLNRIGLSCSS